MKRGDDSCRGPPEIPVGLLCLIKRLDLFQSKGLIEINIGRTAREAGRISF